MGYGSSLLLFWSELVLVFAASEGIRKNGELGVYGDETGEALNVVTRSHIGL